jgi:hypothetical protein
MYFIVFLINFYYQTDGFLAKRPMTLYDHFKVSRLANFEELKLARNDYLENVRLLNDANYTGNKDALVNYTMSEE